MTKLSVVRRLDPTETLARPTASHPSRLAMEGFSACSQLQVKRRAAYPVCSTAGIISLPVVRLKTGGGTTADHSSSTPPDKCASSLSGCRADLCTCPCATLQIGVHPSCRHACCQLSSRHSAHRYSDVCVLCEPPGPLLPSAQSRIHRAHIRPSTLVTHCPVSVACPLARRRNEQLTPPVCPPEVRSGAESLSPPLRCELV